MKLFLFLALLYSVVTSLSANLGGAESISDLGSKEVREVARAVVSHLNNISDSEFKTVLVTVKHGTVQIVAGKKYVLTLVVGTSTDCKKDDASDSCPVSRNSLVTWTAVVFYHPWYSPEYEILSLEKAAQSQYSHRSHKLGAAVPIEDVHDSYVMAAANVAITELNRRSNSLFKTVLVEILHGTVQVVNGVKYSLALQVGMSECRNDGYTATLEQCPVSFDMEETWQAVVWQHPTVPPQYDLLALDKLL